MTRPASAPPGSGPRPMAPWAGFGVIFACFFLSGATGLIYQVVWLRMLGLVFGHTVYAITTVLAAFMTGLALGSFVFSRLAGRIRDLIGAYGWLEVGVGVYCALIPLLLELAASLYLGLHRALGLSYDAFSLVQFLLVFGLLLLPTTLMGGTLPVLSQALVRRESWPGRTVGSLYAVNTAGAVTGVVAAGYVLLPALGNRATVAIAAAANLAVGALAIAYGRSRRAPAGRSRLDGAPPAGAQDAGRGLEPAARLTVIALGVSGAVSMVYEVAWTRALALVIGSSTYAFTSMLLAVLVGIAAGSALYSWLRGARPVSAAAFATLQVGIAAAAALVVLVFERMPELFLAGLRWSDSPAFVQLIQFTVSSAALLLSTLCIGATFPCAVAVAARGTARLGRDVGQVYAVNTLGAIGGAVAAGFVLIPAVGVQGALKAAIAVNLALAVVLFAAAARGAPLRRWSAAGAALAGAVAVLFIPPWDQRIMSSGPAIYGRLYAQAAQGAPLGDVLKSQRVLFYRDGLSGTVSVNQVGPHLFLRVNGKLDAGTAVDMATQLMSGHLPMLFHPAPRAALVIGMGSGITAGAVARHPVERLDVAEIEPAVVEASRFFAREHGDVLKDPRVRTIIADGRNFLLTTPERYDVIISEPSNPWIGGLASLFSVEFFDLARQRLRPGGIMLQWIQGYSMFPEDLRMVVKTFRTAFPAASVWETVPGDFLLLGRLEGSPVDMSRVRNRCESLPGVRQDLARVGVPACLGLLGYFVLGERDTARFAEAGGLNTDDRLPLEFSAPRALYLDTGDRNWQALRRVKGAELPEPTPESRGELERADARYAIGRGYLGRRSFGEALAHFERALQLDPAHAPAAEGAATASMRLSRWAPAFDFAQRALARDPLNADALFAAGVAAWRLEMPERATGLLERAVALQPDNGEFRETLRRLRNGTLVDQEN